MQGQGEGQQEPPQPQQHAGSIWLQRPSSTGLDQKSKWGRVDATLASSNSPYSVLHCGSSGSGDDASIELAVVRRGPCIEAVTPPRQPSSSWLPAIGGSKKTTAAPMHGPAWAVAVEALDRREWAIAQQYGRTPQPPRRYRLGFAMKEEAEAWHASLLPPPPSRAAAKPPSSAAPPAPLPTLPLPMAPAAPIAPISSNGGGGCSGGVGSLEERLERLHMAGYESRLNGLRVRAWMRRWVR